MYWVMAFKNNFINFFMNFFMNYYKMMLIRKKHKIHHYNFYVNIIIIIIPLINFHPIHLLFLIRYLFFKIN